MGFQTPFTIKQAMEKIDKREFLLPAIQREFVWDTSDIELLFDSLMCGFPINSFLFWKVDNTKNKKNYKYYQFMTRYMEYHHETAEPFNIGGMQDFYAVLDGQQRLTALYLGLKGTYAYKIPYARWDNTDNFPARKLYLDICKKYVDYTDDELKNIPEEDYDDEREYGFYFFTEDEFEEKGGASRFFKVEDILTVKYQNVSNMMDTFMEEFPGNKFAQNTISRLQEIIYTTPLINYYLEETEDYDKALRIFVRTNSGGEKLSFSDLLISTIIANWSDAREEFNGLEKEIKNMGFYNFSKEFIVRCALLVYSTDIKFKINNLSKKCLTQFENEWNDENGVKAAIKEVFTLLKNYGHNDNTLTSYNAVAIIVYYLIKNGKTKQFSKKTMYKQERNDILKWLNIVLLKRIFGGQSDSILKDIRDVIGKSTSGKFPTDEIKKKLEGTRKSLSIDDEFLEGLLTEQKDSRYAFPILALLYDGSDYRDTKHKDHLHPESAFTKKNIKSLGLSDEDADFYLDRNNWNSILNLQLLYGNENEGKNKKSLKEWVKNNKIDCRKSLIPAEYLDFKDFRKFIEKRRELLKERLKKAFN